MRIDLLEAFGLDPKVIAILKEKYGPDLLPIQKRAFKEFQILNGGNFLVSSVTSSGKTLIGEILALHCANRGKRVFYLVPTKALAEEKFEQFREDYERAGIESVISTHDRRQYDERIEGRRFHIAIIVYEKLHSLLVGNPKLLNDIGLVLVDDGSNKSCEWQISDHKRKLISRIAKGVAGKIAVAPEELKTLIFTRPKVGYMLDVESEWITIIS